MNIKQYICPFTLFVIFRNLGLKKYKIIPLRKREQHNIVSNNSTANTHGLDWLTS